jgi:predicted nucleic acid-binding protein
MIQFDTNFLVALEDPASVASERFKVWLSTEEELRVSALVWTEYLCGPLPAPKLEAAEVLFPVKEPFLPEDAPLAARLFNASGRRRGSMLDCMIAATALRCRARFATLNRDDFRSFADFGLELV